MGSSSNKGGAGDPLSDTGGAINTGVYIKTITKNLVKCHDKKQKIFLRQYVGQYPVGFYPGPNFEMKKRILTSKNRSYLILTTKLFPSYFFLQNNKYI